MYLVKTNIEPKGSGNDKGLRFKPLQLKGVFIPKDAKTTELHKIKEQCGDYLLKHLKTDHPELEFKVKSVVVTWYHEQFTVVEDKE